MLFLIILVVSILCGFVLPWWAGAVIAFIAALIWGKKTAVTFAAGFGGLFVAWVVLALIHTLPNNNILASRVATLFHLPHWFFLLFVTAMIGGLVGGLAALSGVLVGQVFRK
jgi:hypothetical protein